MKTDEQMEELRTHIRENFIYVRGVAREQQTKLEWREVGDLRWRAWDIWDLSDYGVDVVARKFKEGNRV